MKGIWNLCIMPDICVKKKKRHFSKHTQKSEEWEREDSSLFISHLALFFVFVLPHACNTLLSLITTCVLAL